MTISGFSVTGATKNRHAGICLNGVEGSIITNNIVSDNDFGICLHSNNNMLTGNTVSDNAFGIYVGSSNNNTLTNNTASNNYNGIFVWYSSDNMLTDNTASNYNYGISLEYSSDNTLTDNTASNNEYGIYVGSSSDNTLTSNLVSQNEEFGIYLNRSMDNLIYDNYFNNTNNVYDDGNNIWNITKTPGTNIFGGPFLGGSYWSDYAGADTDGDGLGDTLIPYNSEGKIANGGDYLPLVKPAEPPAPAAIYTVNNGAG
ncbi:right-handed parallel beta-helix repeat-containing protein [Methanosarcina sp. Mfa9]|uniref:right-handed parallel beta-helix repeat-containing protein n=1 Tax=Methanosarcina sp. Mfa9 TaxID=3439063 RepID=UPI003F8282ED